MTVTLDRPPTSSAHMRPSRGAWIAVVLSPVMFVVATWMGFFLLGDEDIKWWGDVIMGVLMAAPPVTALVLGIRSAMSGNRLGAHATAVAAAWVGFMATFMYAANYPYNGESLTMPAVLGAVAAIVLSSAVEVWDRSRRKR